MSIDRSQVDHAAELARLELSDDERERLRGELGQILQAFEALNTLDTEHIPPNRPGHPAGQRRAR